MDELSFSYRFLQTFSEGQTIFEEGEEGDAMYVVVGGGVELSRLSGDGVKQVLATAREGDIFGEMSLIESAPRTATAIARSDNTNLIVIDQAKFIYLVSQQPVFALTIMQSLSKRLRAKP